MTQETPGIGHNSGISGERLKAFIERIERLNQEKTALQDDIKAVFGESKSSGFDVKTMRKIIKLRAMDSDKRQEEDMILDTYKAALGIS